MATVTLPGGNGSFTGITVNNDAKAVLTSAIKNLFNQAGPNITANEIASGVDGTKGFFNLVLDGALAATTIVAGANVQALFDTGLGQDTLLGNSATSLFVTNSAGDSIVSSAAASTVIGGAGNDTVSASGNITAYLEGGDNQVNLSNGSVSLLGSGGNDTVNVVAGNTTVTAGYRATVDLSGAGTKDQVTLATGSTVSVTGSNVVATITGNNETIYIDGSNESINLVGSGDKVIFVGGGNDTITYTSPGHGHGKGDGHSATVIGGGDDHGKDKGHRIAGPDATTIHGGRAALTHTAGERNIFTAGRGTDMMANARHDTMAGSNLFKLDAPAGSTHASTAFSSQRDTISIGHPNEQQMKGGLLPAAITGGGAHTTIFTADNTKITIGDRVLASDIKPRH